MTDTGFSAELPLRTLEDTESLGARIAASLAVGDVVALAGDLGAGKTTLARAILVALGLSEYVPSPSFTLVQRYDLAAFSVSHFDLYRIERQSEVDELGLDDALVEGVALIEWPDRAGSRLPGEALRVQLAIVEGMGRRARLSGPSRWARLMESGERR